MKKANREWALGIVSGSFTIALDGNGFGRGQANAQIISDPELLLGASPFWVNRVIGSISVTLRVRENLDAFGFNGAIAVGIMRSQFVDGEAASAGLIDVLSDEDADNPWVFREIKTAFWRDTANAIAGQESREVLASDFNWTGLYNANLNNASHAAMHLGRDTRPWPVDWALRGGRGTRLEHNVGLQWHMSMVSFAPVTVDPQFTGEDWEVNIAAMLLFLHTTT